MRSNIRSLHQPAASRGCENETIKDMWSKGVCLPKNPFDTTVFRGVRPPGQLKNNKTFLDMVYGSVCTKFQVSVV